MLGCRGISSEGIRDMEEFCVVVVIIAEFEFRCYSVGGV